MQSLAVSMAAAHKAQMQELQAAADRPSTDSHASVAREVQDPVVQAASRPDEEAQMQELQAAMQKLTLC